MKLPQPIGADLDIPGLHLLLDKCKARVFLGKNASFFGSLLCSMNFYWTADIRTAGTNGVSLCWNPYWFMATGPEERATVLMHELWHPARLHHIRRGDRDFRLWNIACDHRINNDLLTDGYSFKGLHPVLDIKYRGWLEEDIYDDLVANPPPVIMGSWTNEPWDSENDLPDDAGDAPDAMEGDLGDMIPGLEESDPTAAKLAAVGIVVQAQQIAQLAGESTSLDDSVTTILKQFLSPIVPWEVLLHKFMQELVRSGRSWVRPNRRYPDLYLPSPTMDRNKLQHLVFFEDTSGSITDRDSLRFNSEVRYIKQRYNPDLLTLVQFDDKITDTKAFTAKDPFEEIRIVGRGGTDLAPVRQWIIDNRPTAAIIFSDLECTPMVPLPFDLPMIWVAINNRGATVPQGHLVHIRG